MILTPKQYLLTCLSEECAEVVQRCTKALRFGLEEVQEGQLLDNRERLIYELNDILAVIELLEEHGLDLSDIGNKEQIDKKKAKLYKYGKYSVSKGILKT